MFGSISTAVSTVVATITTATCAVPVLASFAGAGFGLWFEILIALFGFAFMAVAVSSDIVPFFALDAHEGVVNCFAVFTVNVWADAIT